MPRPLAFTWEIQNQRIMSGTGSDLPQVNVIARFVVGWGVSAEFDPWGEPRGEQWGPVAGRPDRRHPAVDRRLRRSGPERRQLDHCGRSVPLSQAVRTPRTSDMPLWASLPSWGSMLMSTATAS